MANIKPIGISTAKINKEKAAARVDAEENLKGSTAVDVTPPKQLSANGKKIYANIVNILPTGFLNGGDTYTVCIVAEALDRMQECQKQINKNGLFCNGKESAAVGIYQKYSKIFDSFSAKLGLSPKDRAGLSIALIKDKEKEDDPILKVLGGGNK